MFGLKSVPLNSYGIIGLGRFGQALALELAASGAEIIVLDEDEEKVRELREYTPNAYVVKKLDKKTLMESGIRNCGTAIVCIGEELDTSILTTLHLVSMGLPRVIAKATSAEHGEILEKLGAEVVYPERDIAIRLAHRLEVDSVLDYIQLSEKLNIAKILAPRKILGQSVQSVDLRRKLGVNIIAIESGTTIQEIVDPAYIFRNGDVLYLSGTRDGLQKLSEWE